MKDAKKTRQPIDTANPSSSENELSTALDILITEETNQSTNPDIDTVNIPATPEKKDDLNQDGYSKT